jgi:predicted secreted protein with PEFG-CTERM motif
VEPENFGLLVKINSLDDGKIILELPREFIDAEKQNGKDEEFIILINDVQTTYEESLSFSEFRTLTINFDQGDSEIQIIGTYVIPEFGTIVMIILTIGIMASILLTKNRFQIKI